MGDTDWFLRHMLEGTPSAPADLVRLAHRRGTDPLPLAYRGDLPQDVLEALSGESSPAVQAVLASRPVLDSEPQPKLPTAARALAALLTNTNPPHGRVFAAAWAAYTKRPAQALFDALLTVDPDWFTPPDVKTLLRPGFTPRLSNGYGEAHRLARHLSNGDILELATAQDVSSANLRILASVADDTDVAVAILTEAARKRQRSPAQMDDETIKAITGSIHSVVSSEQWADILDKVHATFPLAGTVLSLNTVHSKAFSTVWRVFGAKKAGAVVDRIDDADGSTLAKLAALPDEDVLLSITEQLARLPLSSQDDVIAALLGNFAAPSEVRSRIADHLWWMLSDPTGNEPRAFHETSQLDPFLSFPDDEALASAWCLAFPATVLNNYGWVQFDRFGGASTHLQRWQAGERNFDGWQRLGPMLAERGLSRTLLRQCTFATLEKILGPLPGPGRASTRRARPVNFAMVQMLHEELRTPEHWEAFTALLETNFTGTFGEALDTANALLN